MDPVASLGRLVLSLGVIVAALLVVRHWAQRGRGAVRGAGPGVRVLARTGLTRTSVVAVVEADGRRFLVGSGEDGVRLLTELAPEAADADLGRAPAAGVPLPPSSRRPAGPGTTFAVPTDGSTAPRITRPGTGLLDRLRAMTVRTHVDRPVRVPLR